MKSKPQNPNSPTSFEKKLRKEFYKLQVFRTTPREHTNWWYKQNHIVEAISNLVEEEVEKAYRKGYNDNARDCYCNGGSTPHKHLLDDGRSYDIRPDIQALRS